MVQKNYELEVALFAELPQCLTSRGKGFPEAILS